MRKVNRNWNDKPVIFATQEYRDALKELITIGKDSINDKYYKHSVKVKKASSVQGDYDSKSKVLEKLHESYHHKCAYCETIDQHDIEHYRPKKGVTEAKTHSGYYWLAYEWSNLVPACVKCNRDGGKLNKFAVMGTRVKNPPLDAHGNLILAECLASAADLVAEIPKLLHPELDDPKDYFALDAGKNKGFELTALDTTIEIANITIATKDRANYTIETCKLNREPLCLSRLKAIDKGFVENCETVFEVAEDLDDEYVLKLLKKYIEKAISYANEEKREYTLVWWYVMNHPTAFETLVLSQFSDANQRETVGAVYKAFFT